MKKNNITQNKGITLIALVITIIVMLILVAVTISMAINGGLFDYAKRAGEETNTRIAEEQEFANLAPGMTYNDLIAKYTGNGASGPRAITVAEAAQILATMDDNSAIDQYGNETDLQYWDYELSDEDDTFQIVCNNWEWAYNGELENGTFKYPMPAYIKESDNIYTITEIGYSSFQGMEGLTSVTIPDSVTTIGESAFWDCTSLASVNIPDSVTIIEGAFGECTSLISVEMGDSVTTIGDYAFFECTSLASVNIPDSVTTIGDSAFYGCTSLTSITIPNSVTSIGAQAFHECPNLSELIFEKFSINIFPVNDSMGIVNGVFNNYDYYIKTIIIKEGEIPGYEECGKIVFNYFYGLETLILGKGVTKIGDGCFDVKDLKYEGTEQQWNNISTLSPRKLRKYRVQLYNCRLNTI